MEEVKKIRKFQKLASAVENSRPESTTPEEFLRRINGFIDTKDRDNPDIFIQIVLFGIARFATESNLNLQDVAQRSLSKHSALGSRI